MNTVQDPVVLANRITATSIEHTHDGETEVTVELEPIVEEPPTSEITIRVVNSDNEPIEGATVTGEGQPQEADIPLEFSGETDSNGEYNDVIYENEYTIEVDHPGYRSRTVESNYSGGSDVAVELESAEGDDEDDNPSEGTHEDPPEEDANNTDDPAEDSEEEPEIAE